MTLFLKLHWVALNSAGVPNKEDTECIYFIHPAKIWYLTNSIFKLDSLEEGVMCHPFCWVCLELHNTLFSEEKKKETDFGNMHDALRLSWLFQYEIFKLPS